ncbi:hypothetical protein EV138_0260 [Kribbella voronezhensis]|uniref:Uncharacterized protein n=1 Tax=Kribbella voronezhensis TaxID=2512212 RepID=A0A4R7T532_9ACTN|nr:hypothetical protein EV138_0260 [Kribbella voronezhensis]
MAGRSRDAGAAWAHASCMPTPICSDGQLHQPALRADSTTAQSPSCDAGAATQGGSRDAGGAWAH